MNVKTMKNPLTSNKGFSLVELMVVVAIIGILAAIAVPNVNRYMLKSRQGEAKTNLASLYTAEKALFTEYTVYSTAIACIGFKPEGTIRYNVGFPTAAPVPPPGGVACTNPNVTSLVNAGAVTAACAAGSGCVPFNVAIAFTPNIATGLVNNAAPPVFTGSAIAGFGQYGGSGPDEWSINNLKVIAQIQNGVQ